MTESKPSKRHRPSMGALVLTDVDLGIVVGR